MKNSKTLLLFVTLLSSQISLAGWVSSYNELVSKMEETHETYDSANWYGVLEARNFDELEQNYGNANLQFIQWGYSDEQILENNKNIEDILSHVETRKNENITVEGKYNVSRREAKKLFTYVEDSKMVGVGGSNEWTYDPDEVLGLCFGRAIIAHNYALAKNVAPESIKKIWVLGDMKKWGFHIATMVRGADQWYVLDTYVGFVSATEWMKRMLKDRKKSAKQELMFFVTDATRFGYQDDSSYSAYNLFNINDEDLDEDVHESKKFLKKKIIWTQEELDKKKAKKEAKGKEFKEDKYRVDFYRGYFLDFYKEFDKKKKKIKPFK